MAHRGACDSAVHWPVYWQFTGMHNRRPTASNALCKHWKHRNSGLVWSLFSQGSTQAPSSKTSTSSLKKSTIHASGREPLTCGSCQSHTKPTSSHEFQLAGVPAANLPHSFLWPAFQCAIWHALQQYLTALQPPHFFSAWSNVSRARELPQCAQTCCWPLLLPGAFSHEAGCNLDGVFAVWSNQKGGQSIGRMPLSHTFCTRPSSTFASGTLRCACKQAASCSMHTSVHGSSMPRDCSMPATQRRYSCSASEYCS
mmetsp:Transcript_36977/g.108998  ORF Transcript_36977/g.108998 Transcript_36977/m.108998 type:complete len:255 (+) Transcript_36977:284-1048(+)